MALSSDLIAQFVKITNDNPKTPKETTVYATAVVADGKNYVRIDGSDQLTPVESTVVIKDGERVTVMVKNHTATIIGNISSPAASSKDVEEIDKKILEVDTLIAEKASIKELSAEKARIDKLVAENVTIKGELEASSADISDLKADNVTVKGQLEAQEASIKKLETDKLTAEQADLKYATIENLEATNVDIHNLEATYGEFVVLSGEKFTAVEADIEELNANKLTAEQADLKYANIDFSNIGKAAMEYLFAQSGLIKDVTIENGIITGHLVGVTISGDLIEGNTIVAEKLVIKGDDGLYYKLNTDGVTTEAEQTDYNSLNGQVIKAKTVTAEKVSVSDLVAFGATIGGFTITDNSIYSGVKESADNITDGIYMDSEGQLSVGDSNNYIRYYEDENGDRRLEIAISGAGPIDTAINDIHNEATNAAGRIEASEAQIEMLKNALSTLVKNKDGESMMTQTADGWEFSMAGILDDLDAFNNHIKFVTFEGEPCIELGESDSEFKVLITNTRIMFREGLSTPTYISNNTLITEKINVKTELSQSHEDKGEFVWSVRQNGNYGLMWRGA